MPNFLRASLIASLALTLLSACAPPKPTPIPPLAAAPPAPSAWTDINKIARDHLKPDFPVKIGMTFSEVEILLERESPEDALYRWYLAHRESPRDDDSIIAMSMGRQSLFCQIVFRNNRAVSIWILLGNPNIMSDQWFLLAGTTPDGPRPAYFAIDTGR